MSLALRSHAIMGALLALGATACAASTPEPSVPATQASSEVRDPGGLPEQPTRRDCRDALGSLEPAARACSSHERGTVQLAVVFASDGSVIESHIAYPTDFVGTTIQDPEVLACVARLGRGARVPPFRRDRFQVTFPYRVGPE